MFRVLLVSALFFLNVIVSACSSDSSSAAGTTTLNGSATAINGIKSGVAQAQVFTTNSGSSRNFGFERNADWTTTHLTDLGGENCVATTSPKAYIEQITSRSCTVSPYFDLNNMLDMMCVLANELPETNNLPDVTTSESSVSVSAATGTACGVSDAAGFPITYTVTATSNTTNYQRLISFQAGSSGSRTIMVGTNGTATNIAFTYNEGSTSAYRGFYTTDSATSMTRFALHAISTNGGGNGTIFRVVIDASEPPGEVWAVGTRNDDGTTNVRWTYHAPIDGSSAAGVSMAWNNQSSGTSVNTCVDIANNNAASGTSSTSCGSDYNAPNVTAFGGMANTALGTIIPYNFATFIGRVDEADVITFDNTNIESTALIN